MDIPGLSYARSAAEVTLNIVAPHPTSEPAVRAAMDVDLTRVVQHAASTNASPGGGPSTPGRTSSNNKDRDLAAHRIGAMTAVGAFKAAQTQSRSTSPVSS